jgi:hypothetical protein
VEERGEGGDKGEEGERKREREWKRGGIGREWV